MYRENAFLQTCVMLLDWLCLASSHWPEQECKMKSWREGRTALYTYAGSVTLNVLLNTTVLETMALHISQDIGCFNRRLKNSSFFYFLSTTVASTCLCVYHKAGKTFADMEASCLHGICKYSPAWEEKKNKVSEVIRTHTARIHQCSLICFT